ncbi:hypothetical protein [Flavobacterium okayamense]|uniref:Uncharacterized protein n=1 Tax=Flavobacterium okayamense TaxID=2830782 RepID=A0ABN6HVV9_9FLAO|nr:hypothetical protein [Flavobacterium okayamense]BCY27597.1 hypothetical protein KK2020170_04650 [Flavobacterium okayamense]
MSKKSIILLLIIVISTFLGIALINLGFEKMKSYLIIIGVVIFSIGIVGAVKLYND